MVRGNVKAMIPVLREKLILEANDSTNILYRKGQKIDLLEKRIFGILTPF